MTSILLDISFLSSTSTRQECNTVYEDVCQTVNESVCSTEYSQECTTVYETEYEQQCNTVTEQECNTVNEQGKDSVDSSQFLHHYILMVTLRDFCLDTCSLDRVLTNTKVTLTEKNQLNLFPSLQHD